MYRFTSIKADPKKFFIPRINLCCSALKASLITALTYQAVYTNAGCANLMYIVNAHNSGTSYWYMIA